ncbi:MAG: FAD:protein FMN transferase [Acidobacteriota bacterium]
MDLQVVGLRLRPPPYLKGLAPAALFLLAGVVAACRQVDGGLQTYSFQGPTMGTRYTIKIVAEDLAEERQEELSRRIGQELALVDRKMSHYRKDSELSRFNRWQQTTPFSVSPETFAVFEHAQELSSLTGGALDVTVAPLVNAWGFGPEKRSDEPPSDEHIRRLLARVGYTALELDRTQYNLRKKNPRLECDLSAIAKGYAVDRVAEALEAKGISDYMVEVGGEVRTGGYNAAGKPWRIAVERPVAGDGSFQRIVSLSGLSMATSGDYRNYYEVDGVRISHEIDPRTGFPIRHRTASVSVVEPDCVRADGWATALLVLGVEAGDALARKHDLAALFLVREDDGGFREHATPAFERLIGR